MDDIDFIKTINEDLGASYYIAKSLSLEHPKLSLSELRNSLEILCSMMAKTASIIFDNNDDLYNKINKLSHNKVIKHALVDKLHHLRKNTNKGAHHTDHKNLTYDEWTELISLSLKNFCELVELIAYDIYGLDLEEYNYVNTEEIHFTLAHLCEDAIFNNNIYALYNVGKILLLEVQEQYKDYEDDYSYSGLKKNAPALLAKLRQAYLYMDLANDVPLAEFEIAQLHWDGIVCAQDRKKSLMIYKRLADEGLDEASYTYGHFYFHEEIRAEHNLSKEECLNYLKKSADQGHLEAGILMGRYYLEICCDVESAYKYFNLSAERDHANGLYSIGIMYLKQSQGEISVLEADKALSKKDLRKYAIDYFNKAFKLGSTFAGIKLATMFILSKLRQEDGFKLYEMCLNEIKREKDYNNYFIEKYELAKLYYDTFDSKGLHYIFECFNQTQNFKLKEKIILESKKAIPKRMQVLLDMSEEQLKFISEIPLLFHSSGIPMTTEEFDQNLHKMKSSESYRKDIANSIRPPLLKQTTNKIGRNDLCPCGSGNKYKKCCA